MDLDLSDAFNDSYLPIFKFKNRYLILYGGAGSGKSVAVTQKIVLRMLFEDNQNVMVVRKYYADHRDSTHKEIINTIKRFGLEDYFIFGTTPKCDLTIKTIHNDNNIIFRGVDNNEKIKSIAMLTTVWIEEANGLTLADYNQLDLRLRGATNTYLQLIVSFNPVTANHWLKIRFFDNKTDDDMVIHTTYLENKFVTDDYKLVMDNLKATDKKMYEVYCLGKWGALKGVVYDDVTIVDKSKVPKTNISIYYGLDFGFVHNQTLVKTTIQGNKLYVETLFCESGYTAKDFAMYMLKHHKELKRVPIYADYARPEIIAELKRNGFNIQNAIKDVMIGINKIHSYKIHTTVGDKSNDEFSKYSWAVDADNKPMDKVQKKDDDIMDAMRYSCTPLIREYKNTVKKGKLIGL